MFLFSIWLKKMKTDANKQNKRGRPFETASFIQN